MNIQALLSHSIFTNHATLSSNEVNDADFKHYLVQTLEGENEELELKSQASLGSTIEVTEELIEHLLIHFPEANINFDLSDEDNQSRVLLLLEQLVTTLDGKEVELTDEVYHALKTTLDQLKQEQLKQEDVKEESSVNGLYMPVNIEVKPYVVKYIDDLTYQIAELTEKVNNQLTEVNVEENITKQANNLLDLLAQWSSLSKQTSQQEIEFNGTNRSKDVWSNLLSNYEKRMDLHSKSAYQTNTSVTADDVSKWLTAAINRYNSIEVGEGGGNKLTDIPLVSGQTLSQLEQFTIHLNIQPEQSTNEQNLSEQLIDKFQQALSKSTFMSRPDGSQQLLLRLTPQSLGDVMVQLTQVDGEMMVKLTASTQAAREALEANVKELRHMFMPHQVLIEKQDGEQLVVDHQTWHENNEQQSETSQQDGSAYSQGQEKSSEAPEMSFEEILLNEKV